MTREGEVDIYQVQGYCTRSSSQGEDLALRMFEAFFSLRCNQVSTFLPIPLNSLSLATLVLPTLGLPWPLQLPCLCSACALGLECCLLSLPSEIPLIMDVAERT